MMHPNHFRRAFHSIFTRLSLVTLAAGVAITLIIIIGAIAFRIHSTSILDRNLARYADYIARDLGSPPQLKRAIAMAEDMGAVMEYEHPTNGWRTAPLPEGMRYTHTRVFSKRSDIVGGQWRGYHFFRVQLPEGRLSIVYGRGRFFDSSVGFVFFGMVGALILVVAGAHLVIRRTLKPIRSLHEAAVRVGDGDLDHRVPESGRNEFRDLAEAFNQMTERLSNVLALKDRLLVDVSHELRSPLARMKLALEMMEDDDTRLSLQEDVDQMSAMVHSLLASARMSSGSVDLDRRDLDLVVLIRSISETVPDRVDLRLPESIPMSGDTEKLRSLFQNLIDNALKYSADATEPVQVAAIMEDAFIRVSVTDNGIGIPDAFLPHVFDPFFRVDDSRSRETGGFGLGLSVCKAVVEAHGGTIAIQSVENRGTQVDIVLPL